jgi:hypothetical protein
MVIAGLTLAVSSRLPRLITLHYAGNWTEFPASTGYVLATLGFTILSQVALHRLVDRKPGASGDGRLVQAITRFSVFSLTVYVLHHLVVLWPLWIYGAWTGHEDVTIFWRHAMSPPRAFALSLVFMVACHVLLRGLENVKSYSLEAVLRRVCDGHGTPSSGSGRR